MTKHDYRTALETLGLSQVAAAKVLGIADRAGLKNLNKTISGVSA
jgi:hypothetical protein